MKIKVQNNKSINWENYRIFYYVAKHQNITAASQNLFISQPAVSQSIKVLENRLGCRLFYRKSKGVELTSEGEALYSHIKKAYFEISDAEKGLYSLINLEEGELNIAASDTALKYIILDSIGIFRDKYPQVKISVSAYPSAEALHALKRGDADLAIVASPFVLERNMVSTPIKTINDIFIIGNDYPLEFGSKKIPLKDIQSEDFICMRKGTSTREHLDSFFEANGLLLDVKYSLPENDLILSFTKKNLGIGIITTNAAKDSLISGDVIQVPVSEQIPPLQISIVTKKNSSPYLADKFIEVAF